MDMERLHGRFQKMAWQRQLGNLASTLGRVSRCAMTPTQDDLLIMSLREAAYFIEWAVSHVPVEYGAELAAMQREVLAWRRVWPIEGGRRVLALHARHQSDRLLQIAGLVE